MSRVFGARYPAREAAPGRRRRRPDRPTTVGLITPIAARVYRPTTARVDHLIAADRTDRAATAGQAGRPTAADRAGPTATRRPPRRWARQAPGVCFVTTTC